MIQILSNISSFDQRRKIWFKKKIIMKSPDGPNQTFLIYLFLIFVSMRKSSKIELFSNELNNRLERWKWKWIISYEILFDHIQSTGLSLNKISFSNGNFVWLVYFECQLFFNDLMKIFHWSRMKLLKRILIWSVVDWLDFHFFESFLTLMKIVNEILFGFNHFLCYFSVLFKIRSILIW